MSSHQENNEKVPHEHQVHRTGNWLPSDHRIHKKWLADVIERVEKTPQELHPVLREFKDLIEKNTRIYILVNSMFEEIPSKKPYKTDPVGHKQVRDYHHMLELFNHILNTAPEWNDHEYSVGMVGTPFNAILDWPMVSNSKRTACRTHTDRDSSPRAHRLVLHFSWILKSTRCSRRR
jgi:phosphatidylserine decarboxylase